MVLIVLGIFAVLNLMIVVLNHYFFRTFTWDYGTYNFAFFDYAHGRVSQCLLYLVFVPYSITFMQDHFSLTLILFAPLYWLFHKITFSYTLLIIQWAFIVAGSWATYKLIEFKTQNWKLALLALVYYFVLYGRYSSYQCDCNLAIIGASMLPVFFYYFETKRYLGAILAFAFLCLNREDLPLCLGFICLYLALSHRKDVKQRNVALILMITALVFFFVIFVFIIPALEDENKKFCLFDYTVLGANPFEAIRFIASHPLKSFSYLFVNHTDDPNNDWVKASFYIVYGLSGGLILFFRPLLFICFIPIIAKKMFNDTSYRWGHEMYYSIEVVDLLPIFVFGIIGDFKREKLKIVFGSLLCVITAAVTYYCIVTAYNSGSGSRKYNFLSADFYKSDLSPSVINAALQTVPDGAAVCASECLVPHLAQRDRIFHFPYVGDAEYICVERLLYTYPISREAFDKKMDEILRDPSWHLELCSGPFWLLKKTKTP